ncbi:S41 family peptidase [Thermoproteota archaeon]
MKSRKSRFVLLVVLVLCLPFFSGSGAILDRETKDDTYKELSLFADTLLIIQNNYVDEKAPKDLIYGAMKGMLSSLDPYSEFLKPKEYGDLKNDTEGRFGGVGMEITTRDGLVTVVSPLEGTPAWEAGIKAGDRIVKVDDAIVKDFSLTDAVNLLRGEPDTKVKVTVWREKEQKMIEFDITRALIKIEEIKNVRIIKSGIGYIRMVAFSESTPGDLFQALESLSAQGMEALILDMRYNPGGLLDVAVDASEFFLDKDKLIVSTKSRNNKQDFKFYTKRSSKYKDLPLVLLINEGSASASEIVAGAMQDHKRAILIGEKTFGKGLVQTVLPLPDGSAVKLTTSKYYTPSGRCIDGEGIIPDIEIANDMVVLKEDLKDEETLKEKIVKELKEEEKDEDGDRFLKQLKRDNQLSRAVDVLKGLLIYRKTNVQVE